MGNLRTLSKIGMQTGETPGGPELFLTGINDSFQAVRILLPNVQDAMARILGDEYFCAIPCRDWFICWSKLQSQEWQQRNIEKALADFVDDDYSLTPDILLSTMANSLYTLLKARNVDAKPSVGRGVADRVVPEVNVDWRRPVNAIVRRLEGMKTGWHKRPDNWPAPLQFGVAAICIVPTVSLLIFHHNVLAIFSGLCGFGFWCWLGRATRGFPLLFDMLGMWVLLINGLGFFIALVRILRMSLAT